MGDQRGLSNLDKRKASYEGDKLAVVSRTTSFSRDACRRIASLSSCRNGSDAIGHAAVFLLKVAALETVRRVSRSKCPHVWHGIQALQVFCYPPLTWIQKWAPFKGLVRGIQVFSRPLLFLSVATAFCDKSDFNGEASNDGSGSHTNLEAPADTPALDSSLDSSDGGDGAIQSLASESWLPQLLKELESQGITLPERINKDELHRFHTAANGDSSFLLSSIKKTIRWRETYRILSELELEMWSKMVFWHGYDVENRPCLIVRLGTACANLPSHERPRFAQAVISQVENGVLHLVDKDNPHITVLVDCDGISPLKIPMQMMRSCSAILQDNFPNRLGHLHVIRLPPVVRVIAQTFIQVLRPVTRKKLRIEGNMYQRVLSEYLQTLPSYLGGNCACKICSDIVQHPRSRNAINNIEQLEYVSDNDDAPSPHQIFQTDINTNDNWDHLLRTAVIGIVMMWVVIALIAGFYEPESRPF